MKTLVGHGYGQKTGKPVIRLSGAPGLFCLHGLIESSEPINSFIVLRVHTDSYGMIIPIQLIFLSRLIQLFAGRFGIRKTLNLSWI